MDEIKPVAWGLFVFGGKNNGKLYCHVDTKEQAEQYRSNAHQSRDDITLTVAPIYDSAALAAARREGEIAGMREAMELADELSDTDYMRIASAIQEKAK